MVYTRKAWDHGPPFGDHVQKKRAYIFNLYSFTLCGTVRLSVEKMTLFVTHSTCFLDFNIMEYRVLLLSMSSRFSCPVSTVSARNAWDHDPPFGNQIQWKFK